VLIPNSRLNIKLRTLSSDITISSSSKTLLDRLLSLHSTHYHTSSVKYLGHSFQFFLLMPRKVLDQIRRNEVRRWASTKEILEFGLLLSLRFDFLLIFSDCFVLNRDMLFADYETLTLWSVWGLANCFQIRVWKLLYYILSIRLDVVLFC
jgi:hypothetical protein